MAPGPATNQQNSSEEGVMTSKTTLPCMFSLLYTENKLNDT